MKKFFSAFFLPNNRLPLAPIAKALSRRDVRLLNYILRKMSSVFSNFFKKIFKKLYIVVFLFIFFKKHNRLSHFSINFGPKNTKRHFAFFSNFENFCQFQTPTVFNFTRKSFLRKAIFQFSPSFAKNSFILINSHTFTRTRAHVYYMLNTLLLLIYKKIAKSSR